MMLPIRYAPYSLTDKNRKRQLKLIKKSRDLYKKHQYFTRPKISSYPTKVSRHILKARKVYGINKVTPSRELARKTGCTVSALRQIVRKGEGAYYSSGSRPSQTPQSWGLARLASAITGGKASVVNRKILENGCTRSRTPR